MMISLGLHGVGTSTHALSFPGSVGFRHGPGRRSRRKRGAFHPRQRFLVSHQSFAAVPGLDKRDAAEGGEGCCGTWLPNAARENSSRRVYPQRSRPMPVPLQTTARRKMRWFPHPLPTLRPRPALAAASRCALCLGRRRRFPSLYGTCQCGLRRGVRRRRRVRGRKHGGHVGGNGRYLRTLPRNGNDAGHACPTPHSLPPCPPDTADTSATCPPKPWLSSPRLRKLC